MMFADMVTAFRTLSLLPMPSRHLEPRPGALGWFGIAGFTLGAVVYGVARGTDRLAGDWPEAAAVLAVAAGALLTRAIHLDGLADWFDAAGGAREKERALEIMKDPRTGSFGVTAVVLVIAVKIFAVSRLAESGLEVCLIPAFVASRVGMVLLAVWLPYARAGGGTGSPFISSARPVHLLLSLLTGTVLAGAVCGPVGAAMVIGGLAVSFVAGLWFRRRIGGVTGDTLGAACELVEAVCLLAAGLMAGMMTGDFAPFTRWDAWLF